MNLILCNKPCKYQLDGYCTLENANPVSLTASSDCCYFVPKDNYTNKNKEHQ